MTNRSAGRRHTGLASATVVDVNDPSKEGRVKLLYQWGVESKQWCRVVQLYAGGGYGSFWTPEKDDEVLVAFIHGDPSGPIVLGGMYNGVDKPPVHRSDGKGEIKEVSDVKLFRTRAGHEIRLQDADSADKSKVVIQDKTGTQVITLDSDDSKITIHAKGDIEIGSDGDIKVQAKGELLLEGKKKVKINP